MKNIISFFFTNHLYKGRITFQRVNEIIESYGFTLFEYDLNMEDDITKTIRSLDLINHAEIVGCFTYVADAHHKYIFIRSGETEKDKVHMLLHEIGHIYNEHFATKELVHNTSPKKERQANLFSYTILFWNQVGKAIPSIFALLLLTGIIFTIIPDEPTNNNETRIVYYTESGEVYHLFEDCYHLKNAAILSGTIDDSGKRRVCATCEERAEEE